MKRLIYLILCIGFSITCFAKTDSTESKMFEDSLFILINKYRIEHNVKQLRYRENTNFVLRSWSEQYVYESPCMIFDDVKQYTDFKLLNKNLEISPEWNDSFIDLNIPYRGRKYDTKHFFDNQGYITAQDFLDEIILRDKDTSLLNSSFTKITIGLYMQNFSRFCICIRLYKPGVLTNIKSDTLFYGGNLHSDNEISSLMDNINYYRRSRNKSYIGFVRFIPIDNLGGTYYHNNGDNTIIDTLNHVCNSCKISNIFYPEFYSSGKFYKSLSQETYFSVIDKENIKFKNNILENWIQNPEFNELLLSENYKYISATCYLLGNGKVYITLLFFN